MSSTVGMNTGRALGLALLAACAVLPAFAASPPASSPGGVAFPPPPAPARIRWVESIADNASYVASESWWRKALDKIAGKGDVQRLERPYGLEATNEALYVCDPDAGIVHVFGVEPRRYLRIPDKGRMLSPIDLASDGEGSVWITDSEAGTVCRYDAKGRLQSSFSRGLERPTGIAFDRASRRLYVVDTTAHRVHVLSAEGDSLGVFGRHGNGAGEFNLPTAVWIDGRGHVYVTDAMNFRIQAFDAGGTFLFEFGRLGDGAGDFSKPKGVATDSDGNIYVVDAMFDAVQVFDRDGRLLLAFGAAGSGPGEFWLPSGITIDEHDRIYVADSHNHRVQVFQYVKPPETEEN